MVNAQSQSSQGRLLPEDYFRFRMLHGPQVTTDGRFAAVIVEEGDAKQDKFNREIIVIDLGSQKTARIHHPGTKVRALCFSPDGSKLAWIAGGESADHICLVDVGEVLGKGETGDSDDFEVDRLFEQKALGGVLQWSPEGANLYVDVQRPNPSESGIRVYTSLAYKADGTGLLDRLKTEVWRVSVDGGTMTRVFVWESDITSAALSPDGRQYAFTADHDADATPFLQDLFITDVATGGTRCLLQGHGMTVAPVFSPDGSSVVCIASRADMLADGTAALYSVDIESGTAHEVAPEFDRPAFAMGCTDLPSALNLSGPKFDATGRTVRFLATDRGVSRLYEVDLPTGEPRVISPAHRVAVSQFAVADTGAIVYTASDSTHPDELFLVPADGQAAGNVRENRERQLTKLNEELLAGVQLRVAQPFSCEGADGWPVEGFLQLPPAGDGKEGPYPLVLMIHGGPRGNFGSGFHYEVQTLAAAGIAVLYVNPRGSDSYGKDFANAVINNWGNKDYQDLMAAVDAAVARGYADPERLGVTGYSYGGFMSTWVIGHTNRFKAAAPGGCVTNLVSFHGTSDIGWYWGPIQHSTTVWEGMEHLWSMSPLAYVQNVKTPALLYHAERDDRCPIGQTEEFYAALKKLGQDVTFVRYPGESHVGLLLGPKPSLRVDIAKRIVAWFSERL